MRIFEKVSRDFFSFFHFLEKNFLLSLEGGFKCRDLFFAVDFTPTLRGNLRRAQTVRGVAVKLEVVYYLFNGHNSNYGDFVAGVNVFCRKFLLFLCRQPIGQRTLRRVRGCRSCQERFRFRMGCNVLNRRTCRRTALTVRL